MVVIMKICNKKSTAISLMWAAAILSAAILDAPQFLTLVILPVLGFMSVTMLNKTNNA